MTDASGSFEVEVRIVPRKGILDPQGATVADALRTLGFGETGDVHVGRYIVVSVSAPTEEAATDRVRAMCEQLLANPVTEDFSVSVLSRG